jgi:hypothetical protein
MQLVTCEIIKCDDNTNKNLITFIALRCYIIVTDNNIQEEHKHIIKQEQIHLLLYTLLWQILYLSLWHIKILKSYICELSPTIWPVTHIIVWIVWVCSNRSSITMAVQL